MIEDNIQNIYINMDDSGRLVKNEPEELVFVYGGVFFLSLEEQEDFSRQYKALVNLIKPKYCFDFKKDLEIQDEFCLTHNHQNCKYNCPELKSNMLKPSDRRRLLNFIKKYDTSVAVISNHRIKDYIFDSKASKGRFKDYVIKREVKRIVENLISQNRINPNSPVKILSSVIVKVRYKNSYYNYPVQAADLLVGEVRHCYYNYLKNNDFTMYRKKTNFLNTSIYLP